VLAAGGSGAQASRALAWLCEAYWYPLYVFVRRRGYGPDQARDLTQSYFANLLERRFFEGVDPAAGRFRAFLLATLKHHLAKERTRERAAKRRADNPAFQVPLQDAENRYHAEPEDGLSPESLFERHWAATLLARALRRLSAEQNAAGKGLEYRRLRGYLTGEGEGAYAEAARDLSMSEGAVKVGVHRLRKRLGRLLREEVSQTVANPGDVDDEVRHLLRVSSS
jgi:RNA polymerase sigma-70 factor (ECF subfamily)